MKQSQELAEKYPAVIDAKKELKQIKKKFGVDNHMGRYPTQVAVAIRKAKTKIKKVTEKTKLDIRKGRVEAFMAEMIKNGGDPTAAAKVVFGCTSHGQASNLGYNMMKEAKVIGRSLLASKGVTYGKLLDIAIDKAYTSKKVDWFDRLMKIGEFHDFMPRNQSQGPSVAVNIIGNAKDDAKAFGFSEDVIEGEEVKDGK
jgi:hypothetical protein